MSEVTNTVEIDNEVIDAVSAKTIEALKGSMVMPTAEEIADAVLAKTEKTVEKKAVTESTEKTPKTSDSGFASLSKEVRFAKGLIANLRKDAPAMAEYNSFVAKAWGDINKSDYQNVTTTVDGGALVPDPEFVAEIERLTDEYGVVARLADIRRTDRDSVTLLSGTNEVSFTKANEATATNAQKLTYASATVALEKYVATLVMTSEIVEDSAINLFQDATNEIARARAKLFDQLVFTDATHGLLSAGVGDAYKTLSVGSAITDFSFDDAMNATYKVVSSVRRSGRFYMHPTVWNQLRQTKTGVSGDYFYGGAGEAPVPMIDGYMVELVDTMPAVGDITANEAFAVFGDLSRVKLHVKRLLETKVFDSGVVKDAGGTDINLITQDSWAMRATLRCVPQTRFEGAFCIIGTGWVS
jgi:HK97 family phage major capsid protein